MSCIVVEGHVCGLGGVGCINETCICAESWANDLEMDLLFSNDARDIWAAPCDSYSLVIMALYWGMFGVFLIGLTVQVCILRTSSQLKRTSPMILGYLSVLVSVVRRLSGTDVRFGEDSAFTVFLMNGFACFYLGCAVFLSKYFNYLYRQEGTGNNKSAVMLLTLLRPRKVGVMVFVGYNLFSLACVCQDIVKKRVFMRMGFFLTGFFAFVWMVITNVAMYNARKSFRAFLTQNDSSTAGEQRFIIQKKLKRQLRTTKDVQNFTNFITTINIVVGWSACFSDAFFYLWKYSLPIFVSCWGLFILTTTLIAWKSRASRAERSAAERIISLRKNAGANKNKIVPK